MDIKGVNINKYFPDVAQVMHRQSTDLKRYAYIILEETCSSNKEKALMPINSLMKETSQTVAIRRGDAIKTLSSIALKEVVLIVDAQLKASLSDMNPYVR